MSKVANDESSYLTETGLIRFKSVESGLEHNCMIPDGLIS